MKKKEKSFEKKLDKQERWVDGVKVNTSTREGIDHYYKLLEEAQKKSKRAGS